MGVVENFMIILTCVWDSGQSYWGKCSSSPNDVNETAPIRIGVVSHKWWAPNIQEGLIKPPWLSQLLVFGREICTDLKQLSSANLNHLIRYTEFWAADFVQFLKSEVNYWRQNHLFLSQTAVCDVNFCWNWKQNTYQKAVTALFLQDVFLNV